MNYTEFLKLISPIIVGFFAAYYGSLLALRKFKKEKVWDERRSAYKEVIESFEELIHWAEQVRASHCCEPVIGGEANFDQSLRRISKYASTGSLIFSKEFHSILVKSNTLIAQTRFQVDEESKPDLYNEIEISEWNFILSREMRKIAEDYLPQLINVAKSEIQ